MSQTEDKTITVWDPLVRIFHWSLVSFFILSYLTEDDWMTIHSYAGYVVGLLLLFRLFWGVAGSRFARFSNFVTSTGEIKVYLQQLFSGNGKHYLGHNPAGGLMIIILILCLILVTLTGIALFAIEGQGPLAGTFLAQWPEDPLEDIHEFLANFTVLMVIIHISGVLISSFLHKENLVKAMLTGKKQITDASVYGCNDKENYHAKS